MSNRNNDVFQVLPTSGNLAVLAAGADISTLAVGQIGCFDANTNLSVTTAVREFYFAVGIDRNGDTVVDDIRTSAGQFIQNKGLFNYSFQPHTAGRPDVWVVGGYKAVVDTDYAIKVEFKNSRIQRQQGFNQFTKTYAVRTGDASVAANGDANTLTKQLVAEIALDNDGILLAQAVTRTALTIVTHGTAANYPTPGTAITDADINALIVFNAAQPTEATKVYTDIRLTSVPLVLKTFFNVNLGFHKFTQTALGISLVDGFTLGGTITNTQVLAYEEGSGNNIRQKEYHASGWNGGGPYVLSEVTGTANNIDYLASLSTKYDQFIVEYDFATQSGWKEYSNPLSTIFAVPGPDTVTRNSLATLLDTIMATGRFEALADDASAANVDPAVVEAVITDVTKDGVA